MHLICILHKNSPKGNFHYKETFTKIYLKMFREFSYLYQKFKSCLSLSTLANAEIYIFEKKTWKKLGRRGVQIYLDLISYGG